MAIKLGTQDVAKAYLGTEELPQLYLGTIPLFPTSTTQEIFLDIFNDTSGSKLDGRIPTIGVTWSGAVPFEINNETAIYNSQSTVDSFVFANTGINNNSHLVATISGNMSSYEDVNANVTLLFPIFWYADTQNYWQCKIQNITVAEGFGEMVIDRVIHGVLVEDKTLNVVYNVGVGGPFVIRIDPDGLDGTNTAVEFTWNGNTLTSSSTPNILSPALIGLGHRTQRKNDLGYVSNFKIEAVV